MLSDLLQETQAVRQVSTPKRHRHRSRRQSPVRQPPPPAPHQDPARKHCPTSCATTWGSNGHMHDRPHDPWPYRGTPKGYRRDAELNAKYGGKRHTYPTRIPECIDETCIQASPTRQPSPTREAPAPASTRQGSPMRFSERQAANPGHSQGSRCKSPLSKITRDYNSESRMSAMSPAQKYAQQRSYQADSRYGSSLSRPGQPMTRSALRA